MVLTQVRRSLRSKKRTSTGLTDTARRPPLQVEHCSLTERQCRCGLCKEIRLSLHGNGSCSNYERAMRYYIESRASGHLISTKDGLRAYRDFDQPIEIAESQRPIVARSTPTALATCTSRLQLTVSRRRLSWTMYTTHRRSTFGSYPLGSWTVKAGISDFVTALWNFGGTMFSDN